MTPRMQALELALRLSVTIEVERDRYSMRSDRRETIYRVEAPRRHHWSDGVHEIVENDWDGVLARMRLGTEECTSECEWW